MYTRIFIDNNDLLNLFIERLNFFNASENEKNLFSKMYENKIKGKYFEDARIDIKELVDNDFINNCQIFYKDDLTKEDVFIFCQHYENLNFDISEENFSFGNASYIEAVSDDGESFLIRW